MGTVIIFALVAILSALGTVQSLVQKNIIALGFAGASTLVFGWFTIMTIISMTHGGGIPGGGGH